MRVMARISLPMALAAFLCFAGAPARAQLLSLDLSLSSLVGGGEDSSGLVSGIVSDIVGGLGDIVEGVIGGEGGRAPDNAVVEHPAALGAIANQQAIPMDQLLQIVARVAAGQVIDVRMIVVQQILLYEVKVLAAGGVVSNLYFIAQNGQQVLVY
jgi:hypothetical protein